MILSNVIMMSWVLITICLCGRAASQVTKAGPCPAVEPMKNFEMSKFLGIWHDQEMTLPPDTTADSKCLIRTITIGSNGSVEMIFTYTNREKGVLLSELADIYAPDSGNPGKLRSKFSGDDYSTELWILGTDYTSVAVIFVCVNNSTMHDLYVNVLTRDQNGANASMDKGHEFVAQLGIDKSELTRIKQTDCALRPDQPIAEA